MKTRMDNVQIGQRYWNEPTGAIYEVIAPHFDVYYCNQFELDELCELRFKYSCYMTRQELLDYKKW